MMKSLNQDSAAIYSWCLKWHIRLNLKKSMISRSRTYAPSRHGDHTLGQGWANSALRGIRVSETVSRAHVANSFFFVTVKGDYAKLALRNYKIQAEIFILI